jgi:hypothetical protein
MHQALQNMLDYATLEYLSSGRGQNSGAWHHRPLGEAYGIGMPFINDCVFGCLGYESVGNQKLFSSAL